MSIRKAQRLAYQLYQLYKRQARGFTLIELLVAILMSGIVLTSLTALLIEMIQTDQREEASTRTQQEMQKAINYIADELRGAVYIYDNPTALTVASVGGSTTSYSLFDHLPNFDNASVPGTVQPILAFWKSELLGDSKIPTSCTPTGATASYTSECNALRITRSAYTLVVYLQSTEQGSPWQGASRILRYELPKYTNLPNDLTRSTGFIDPAQHNNFTIWPRNQNGNNLQQAVPVLSQSPTQVLTDFVDDPMRNPAPGGSSICPSGYNRLPRDNTSTGVVEFNSFFVCIRDINNLGNNQDIILYLRGSSEGRTASTTKEILPTIQTRVVIRGVIDKFR